jgi:hypothetical protein
MNNTGETQVLRELRAKIPGGGGFQKLSQNSGNSRKSGTVREDTAHGALTPPSPRGRELCHSGRLQVPLTSEEG